MSVKMKPINFLALVALAMTSPFVVAQEAKTVVNYHTTVERMFNLEDGMTLSQVNETLGSEPYDLLQNTQGGYLMLEEAQGQRSRHGVRPRDWRSALQGCFVGILDVQQREPFGELCHQRCLG
jgi:hypothetical protein